MADDVFVLNEGQAIPTDFTASPSSNIAAGTFNRNTSVNPNIVTEAGSNTTALGIHCYEIHSDSASSMGSGTVSSSVVNRLYPLNTTIPSYAENKFDSTNYRVIIDTDSATGLKEGSHLLGSSSCTRDYFIVIYADDIYKHHVAKITEQSLYEGNFYKFDFTPSLKENISAGTKVAIYQGPVSTDNVVAVGYGLLNDVALTEERHDKYVNVSRPTFYFYEGTSLEPNTKYTALKTSTNSTGPQISVFKTAPITSDKLLDKSFFTHTATIVDVNKSNDDDVSQPKGINSYTAVGSNYTFAKGTYAQSSLNIYDSDGGFNTYLQFVDSPERTQLLSTPYQLNTSKTVTTRGNMFEAKYYDTERILEHKIRDYEDIKIKEIIHNQNVSTIPESALPGIFSRKSSTTIEVTGLLAGQDLRTLLYDSTTGIWEPFFVDNYYYECAYTVATAITAPVDGVQTITISDSRAVTSNFWSGSASVHTFTDKTAYRKFYSRVTGTILIGHEIDTEYDGTTITRNGITLTETESDIYNLEYSIQGTNYGRHLKVARGDKNNGYVTLVTEPTSSYFGLYTSPLSGNLLVSKTTFEGKVETKETSIESTGAFKLSISGRDKIATLLNTPVNRNYTYSKEYVYSTFSPYNTNYTSIGRTIDSINPADFTDATCDYTNGGTTITIDSTANLAVDMGVSGTHITSGSKIVSITNDTTFEISAAVSSNGTNQTLTFAPTDSHINVNADITGTLLEFGDVIYVRDSAGTYYYLLGVVKSVNGQNITLVKDSYITELAAYTGNTTLSTVIYKANKALLAGKTLETSLRTAERATTLIGTADKGAVFTDGKYFNYDGTVYSDTERLSALGSGGNTNGVDIDNLLNTVNTSTTYFDSPVGFDFEHHTISSMVDFPVLNSIDLKNGLTQYEVGYISPIVLGRIETENTDNFIDVEPTAQALKKGHNIYLINGQGMRLGGYLHLLNNELNADKSPKTFNNIFQDDSAFGSTKKSQYATRFNTPIWRYSNLSKSKLLRRRTQGINIDGTLGLHSNNNYYEKDSNYNFYASGYKANSTTIPLADYHADDTLSYRKELPTERTGVDPVVGATSYLMTRYPDFFHESIFNYGKIIKSPKVPTGTPTFRYELAFGMYDNYSGPLHIFSVGDIYPESKKNVNNFAFTDGSYSRNLEDYSVVFKGEEKGSEKTIVHNNWSGKTTIKNRLDDDYFYRTIQSTKGDLRRANLLRLTEVTYDYLFNEVDFETYKLNNSGTEETKLIHSTATGENTLKAYLVKSFPESGFSPIHITLAADIPSITNTISVNDVRFYNANYHYYLFTNPHSSDAQALETEGIPKFIGKVSSVAINSGDDVITLTGNYDAGVVGYSSGEKLYVIVSSSDLVGTPANYNNNYYINAGYDNHLAHTILSHVGGTNSGLHLDNNTTYNYNKALAITNYGDGGTSTQDNAGTGTAISNENKKPLNDMAVGTHDLNAILLPNPFDIETYKTTSSGTNQMFLWKADANFNGAVMTISGASFMDFFTDTGSQIEGASFLTNISNSFDSTVGFTAGTSATTISFNATAKTITRGGSDGTEFFTSARIDVDEYVIIEGAANAANNGEFLVTGRTDSVLTIVNDNMVSEIVDTISWGKAVFTEDTVIEISNAPGYNGNYKIIELNDTMMTLHSDKSGTLATFGASTDVTDVIIKLYQSAVSSSKTLDTIIPHRILQDTLDNGTTDTSFGFNYAGTKLIIAGIWSGNARAVSPSITANIPGAMYNFEPNRLIYREVENNGIQFASTGTPQVRTTGTSHTFTRGKFLDYGYNDGDADDDNGLGILESNEENDGTDFAGVTPVEVLFKPYIDVSDFIVHGTTLDDSLTSSERVLSITINHLNMGRGATQSANHWIHYSNNLTGYYLMGEKLHKIISHTVSKDTSSFIHYLKIDNASGIAVSTDGTTASTDTDELTLLKINQICTYDFSPKEIQLNTLSTLYTRKPNTNQMLESIASATHFTGDNISLGNVRNEGIRSMYCLIEPDGGGGNYLIPRADADMSYTNSFNDGTHRVLITDGVNKLDTEMFVKQSSDKLQFLNMKKMIGSPSIGSIFTITVNQNPSFTPKSLSICSPFNISLDSEDIADDILTSAGISYTKDTSTDNYYIGSNFTGENAYTAINNVLSFKKKKLTIDGDTIRVVSNEEEKEYRSIEFDEENNIHKVTSIKKNKSLYDNFNEVIVFGDGVKGTAKNYREIKKRGSRAKEVYDFSLVTNSQVSEKAQQLLKLYTSLQSAIEIEVGDKIPLLQPGNIVSIYYPSEGIFRNDYMVIEVEKNIGMPTKLLLGEYNRDLANTFTMLISETRNLQGRAKQKVYTSVTSPNIDIQALRVKFVKATITNTSTAAGTSTVLGFTKTLGFNSRTGLW